MIQLVQILGAVLVLAGFLAAQLDFVDRRAGSYLIVNTVGSTAMAATAVITGDWGFVMLEGVWALVSLWAMLAKWGPDWVPRPAGDAGDAR